MPNVKLLSDSAGWPEPSWSTAAGFSWGGIVVRSELKRGLLEGMLYDEMGAGTLVAMRAAFPQVRIILSTSQYGLYIGEGLCNKTSYGVERNQIIWQEDLTIVRYSKRQAAPRPAAAAAAASSTGSANGNTKTQPPQVPAERQRQTNRAAPAPLYNRELYWRRLPESGPAWVEGLNGWITSVGVGVGVRVWMREGQGSPNHQKKRTRRAAGSESRMDNDWKREERDSAGQETR
ncbi:hypothetical protein EKO27_g360 [Xylaria grammica]|uniref:Uncharacterized protein n=1 Tax=Xylaria grammica TaxID=363999 RepID=A0A439DJZ0_9PEZI|nr:hypothetical protein EKO27_g360 [Xylaria grammica]